MLTCAAPKVRDLLAKNASEVEIGLAVELEFLRVAVKDSFIYETGLDTSKSGIKQCLGWRACFVTPSLSCCNEFQQSSLQLDECTL